MEALTEVRVPDIGDFSDVPIVEIMVSTGDYVTAEESLLTLETDKAAMDVPSPANGIVKKVHVSIGNTVSKDALLISLEECEAETTLEIKSSPKKSKSSQSIMKVSKPTEEVTEVRVPHLGDFDKIPIVEIYVTEGMKLERDDAIVTLESDKASMDVPSPFAGTVTSIAVSVGDEVSEGDLLTVIQKPSGSISSDNGNTLQKPISEFPEKSESEGKIKSGNLPVQQTSERQTLPIQLSPPTLDTKASAHATPSVRRFARELGVDISAVPPTGRKGRVLHADVTLFVKTVLSKPMPSTTNGGKIPSIPEIDFSKYGRTETKPLERIKKISGANLQRSWLTIPHVTHHDNADITDLEEFRKSNSKNTKQNGIRLTLLAFIMKACTSALKLYPVFNSSLDSTGENLIIKHYFNFGIAVDTPQGLVVPVIRDVDKKGVENLAEELSKISKRARDKKLSPADMQGSCFTISSLGGIGGTAFTPIINAPEVAILGISRSRMTPIYVDGNFVPRLILPLSLSYDHRVIDGAQAAHFMRDLCELLSDIRRLLL